MAGNSESENFMAQHCLMNFVSMYSDSLERRLYRSKLLNQEFAYQIDSTCLKVCLNIDLDFKNCFNNCEIKLLSSKYLQDAASIKS